MFPHSGCYRWKVRDKLYYFLSLLPFIIGFVGAACILASFNIYLLLLFIVLYLVANVFQAGACVGCPYRGRFCTAIFGIYLANIISSLIYKNRTFNQRFFNINAEIASTVAIITSLIPVYWLFISGWYYLVAYIVLTAAHIFLFYRLFCPKCSYHNTCPGGRMVLKLSRR